MLVCKEPVKGVGKREVTLGYFVHFLILEQIFNYPFKHFDQTVLKYQTENWQRNVEKVLINVYWRISNSSCHDHLELVHFGLDIHLVLGGVGNSH